MKSIQNTDHRKRIKRVIITFILLAVSIVLFGYSKYKVESQDIDYEAVKVTVIRAEEKRHRTTGHGYYTYHVTVEYEGDRYELINVQSGEMGKYKALANLEADLQHNNPYIDNTVYYSKGKMYSNIAGIKTDSKVFDWNMVWLAAVCVFGALHWIFIADVISRKKKG